MSVHADLFDLDERNIDLHQLYAHATINRMFDHGYPDVSPFQYQIPGLKEIVSLPEYQLTGSVGTLIFFETNLLRFDQGWIVVYGGTRLLGWPQHILSAMAPPTAARDFFSGYWWDAAQQQLAAIGGFMPPGDSKPIVFNGHSLGGAVAVTSAYQDFDRTPSRNRRVITFGCPKVRAAEGMDGRDFTCLRVQNVADLVPFMPVNPIPWRSGAAIFKPFSNNYRHYGQQVFFHHDGSYRFDNGVSTSGLLLPVVAFGHFADGNFLSGPHVMAAYCYKLRLAIKRYGVDIDPFWDKVNDFLNRANAFDFGISWSWPITWNIAGFPAQAATVANPNPLPMRDIEETLDEVEEEFQDLVAPLTGGSRSIPVIKNQSLAAFMNSRFGFNLADITVHLSRIPVAHPEAIDIDSFAECQFKGYQPVGGALWITTPSPILIPTQRFALQAKFSCTSNALTDTAHAWYMLGWDATTGSPSLLQAGAFGVPFDFVAGENMLLELEVVPSPI